VLEPSLRVMTGHHLLPGTFRRLRRVVVLGEEEEILLGDLQPPVEHLQPQLVPDVRGRGSPGGRGAAASQDRLDGGGQPSLHGEQQVVAPTAVQQVGEAGGARGSTWSLGPQEGVGDPLGAQQITQQQRDVEQRRLTRAVRPGQHLIAVHVDRQPREAAVVRCLDPGDHS
jgi:hypothetical protein